MSVCLSTALWAGGNDLLWDYTEAAPTGSSDNGLYYSSIVNDAAGTKNGLKGVKLNSSGYAYFTKAAVAGKLKLTFGPREGVKASSLKVETWEGEAASATKPTGLSLIANTEELTESGTVQIDLTAEQNNIYIERLSSVEIVLQKVQFIESVPRSFVDFEMVMCNLGAEYDFSTLPQGVTAGGTFNNDQHGYRAFTITVPVDGTVRFTIGDCQYGNQPIPVKNRAGSTIATLAYPKAGCYSPNTPENVFQYIYLGDADTLTFGPIQYCNYFKAEAAEITPCVVTYKDQNGTVLGKFDTYEGATLTTIPYNETDLPAIGDDNAFRGWFYPNGKKAQEGDAITGNTTLQAKVTPMETATVGSVQTYNFASNIFYPEDHETVEANGGKYYNNHGWYFNADGDIRIQVAGNAIVVVTLCQYSESGDVILSNGETEIDRTSVVKNETADGTEFSAQYEGEATTLTLHWTAKQYIHKVVVYNVLDFLEKDEATGYFMVPAGDVASFLLALVQAESGDKIFLPNGVYDLGETVLTTISKDNISVIGQSMEGVIIKNAPDAITESIDKTATLKINKNVSGTYLQDLTLQNALDYYKNDNGRAVALWDQGTKTVCKNVRLLSYQDTYYSNLSGALKYFEDCEIHGTVDYICGDGKVYFKNNLLYCEKRNKAGSGSDAVTANNGQATEGYVFEGCTLMSECATVSLGRAWNNTPTTIFLNTLVDYSAGQFGFTGSGITRWTEKLMNANAWPVFGEYNTHLEDGTVITPESNIVTFLDEKSNNATRDIETVLSDDGAQAYSYDNFFGTAWDPAAEAEQVELSYKVEGETLSWQPTTARVFLVETAEGAEIVTELPAVLPEGTTVRAANAHGGFGPAAEDEDEVDDALENTTTDAQVEKMIENGQVYILKDGVRYTTLGVEVKN